MFEINGVCAAVRLAWSAVDDAREPRRRVVPRCVSVGERTLVEVGGRAVDSVEAVVAGRGLRQAFAVDTPLRAGHVEQGAECRYRRRKDATVVRLSSAVALTLRRRLDGAEGRFVVVQTGVSRGVEVRKVDPLLAKRREVGRRRRAFERARRGLVLEHDLDDVAEERDRWALRARR